MSAHYVQQPLIRLTVLVTPEQKEALAADAAETGKAMAQIVRDFLDARYFGNPKIVAGWHLTAAVRRPEDTSETPPARARLREWISRSRRRS
jgi:hypothetical protein